jgi:cell wall-associated NlpC family hydrolase/prophage tail gpP-like protein
VIRKCQAIVVVQKGRGGSTQHRVQRVESYTTDESMDQDADSFTITIDDSSRELEAALDRDNEVRVNLFINDGRGDLVPIFTGLADSVEREKSYTLSITGRDLPSALATDTDALPQRWKHVQPAAFIEQQAHTLGIASTTIHKMSQINTLFTDGSETVWAFWYRIARMRKCWMWTNHLAGGTLIVNQLGYSLWTPHLLGDPPKGQPRNNWQQVEEIIQISTKQGRKRRIIVYGAAVKKGKTAARPLIQQGVDTTIPSWKKQPVSVMTSTVDKTNEELKTRADNEIFESIVGAVEWQLTVRDTGQLIQQNRMCRINMPHYMPVGNYFIVGVTRQGDANGMLQTVRVREKGFALSKRVPDPPVLAKTKTSVSDDYKPAASISSQLQTSGVGRKEWADYFVRATREFGGSWDFAVFLGALMAICEKETGFRNIRQNTSVSALNGIEWFALEPGPPSPGTTLPPGQTIGPVKPTDPAHGTSGEQYSKDFANEGHNADNPMSPNSAGVGPMQLTDQGIKDVADNMGWNGVKKVGELDGGRWNPESNIRAAAKLLFEKGQIAPPTNPLEADQIWINVQRYNGSGPAAEAYRIAVKKLYDSTYGPAALASVTLPKSIPPGTTDTHVNIPGHGQLVLPDDTPDVARKAIAFALSKLGDPYLWNGSGPYFDCSSFCGAALASASGDIKGEIDYPYPGHHGWDTTDYFKPGRFNAVDKDALKPADLVFFVSDGTAAAPGHMGMYLDDGLFIHDPHTGDVVKVSGLNEDYYVQNYAGARRVVNWTNQADTSSASGWLTKVGPYEVEQMPKSGGGTVDLGKPATGVMHTTEGSTFTGALDTLNSNSDHPTFMVGVEAAGAIRVAQFFPFGTSARALKHTGDPETNGWARAQIECVGYSDLLAPWQPSNPTFSALAALMAALSRAPWNIPLSRPLLWGDTYDASGARRVSGAWGANPGWFGHCEMPENDHHDPGQLKYSSLFTAAGGY